MKSKKLYDLLHEESIRIVALQCGRGNTTDLSSVLIYLEHFLKRLCEEVEKSNK